MSVTLPSIIKLTVMKKLYFLLPAIFLCFYLNAQFKLGTNYSLLIPQGEMGDNINPVHTVNLSFLYTPKVFCQRFSVGTEMGFGNYAYVTKEQDLRFPDGSGIKTDVVYTSNVVNAALVLRANLAAKGKMIPYIEAKAGNISFFSNVYVADPEDQSSCKPLEAKNIIRDNTFFATYGGGVQVDVGLFDKKATTGKFIIDIGINRIKGGKLDYINTKNIQTHVHTDPNAPVDPGKGEPLNIQFINITTQTIHEHQVAELHNSQLRMIGIKIGMLFKLGKS